MLLCTQCISSHQGTLHEVLSLNKAVRQTKKKYSRLYKKTLKAFGPLCKLEEALGTFYQEIRKDLADQRNRLSKEKNYWHKFFAAEEGCFPTLLRAEEEGRNIVKKLRDMSTKFMLAINNHEFSIFEESAASIARFADHESSQIMDELFDQLSLNNFTTIVEKYAKFNPSRPSIPKSEYGFSVPSSFLTDSLSDAFADSETPSGVLEWYYPIKVLVIVRILTKSECKYFCLRSDLKSMTDTGINLLSDEAMDWACKYLGIGKITDAKLEAKVIGYEGNQIYGKGVEYVRNFK